MRVIDQFLDQLESLFAISVQIASLRSLPEIYDLALTFGLGLTASQTGFIGLVNEGRVDMDLVAVKGFAPPDPKFFERFRRMPLRPSVFGIVITEGRPNISEDVENDPATRGQPPGHPRVRRFLGVPLRVSDDVVGMIGVGNKQKGYGPEDERLLSTFANQVAVTIDNAMLHEHQQEMIARLQQLDAHLSQAEREQLIALERERMATGLRPDPSSSIRTRPSLNKSQQEILRLIAEGLSNKEIAGRIHLSENTVKSHIQEILRRLEARNRVQAAVRAGKGRVGVTRAVSSVVCARDTTLAALAKGKASHDKEPGWPLTGHKVPGLRTQRRRPMRLEAPLRSQDLVVVAPWRWIAFGRV